MNSYAKIVGTTEDRTSEAPKQDGNAPNGDGVLNAGGRGDRKAGETLF